MKSIFFTLSAAAMLIASCAESSDPTISEPRFLVSRDDSYKFLHDCAITEYKGRLFTAWYNCPDEEMSEASVIRGAISEDGGVSWSSPRDFIKDSTALYVPPAFGTDGEHLYMFVSRMHGADLLDDCETFLYDDATESFHRIYSFGELFLPNTPAQRLASGRWIIGGRVSDSTEDRPRFPAVAISNTDDLSGQWSITRISPLSTGPDGCPETGLIISPDGHCITAYVRSHAVFGEGALIYTSSDEGISWSGPSEFGQKVLPAKLTPGRLPDGRLYIIGDADNRPDPSLEPGVIDRTELAMWITTSDDTDFSEARKFTLASGTYENNGMVSPYHYPAVCLVDNTLHLAFTCARPGDPSEIKYDAGPAIRSGAYLTVSF